MKENIGIIIQARMGSQRLPGKVLKKIGDRPLLQHIVERLQKLPWPIVVATSSDESDFAIANFCQTLQVVCFRGPLDDVLARYYHCASEMKFDYVVRLTSDNPFVDPEELKNLLSVLNKDLDYVSSKESLPVGIGAEAMNFTSLERAFNEGKNSNHREHVTEYITENPDIFHCHYYQTLNKKIAFPQLSFTVDTQEDYLRACFIQSKSKHRDVTTEDAIEICRVYER